MAGSATTQAAALTALCDLLVARPGLADAVVVSAQFPIGFHGDKDVIELWATEGQPQEFRSLGGRTSDEIYAIHAVAYAWSAGADEATVRDARGKVERLIDEVYAVLRASPALGGAVRVTGYQNAGFDQGFDDTGRFCVCEFRVRCEARLGLGL